MHLLQQRIAPSELEQEKALFGGDRTDSIALVIVTLDFE